MTALALRSGGDATVASKEAERRRRTASRWTLVEPRSPFENTSDGLPHRDVALEDEDVSRTCEEHRGGGLLIQKSLITTIQFNIDRKILMSNKKKEDKDEENARENVEEEEEEAEEEEIKEEEEDEEEVEKAEVPSKDEGPSSFTPGRATKRGRTSLGEVLCVRERERERERETQIFYLLGLLRAARRAFVLRCNQLMRGPHSHPEE
uniref:Uncharacterized protein n=1 Tax=Chromera velia CCMP2878 TaxID=1169474 RepID=A0A0G4FVF2_9ALVE|eukprot:Cvel_500.t1-p1 / transcript=Cvel_500.t1 / gene=Cvel_500 / organism=Chromera_velia_CCMP2878 / gene_product=hypothetical protein / transcript_product=hypothetical protein / location=Cvel_scaffold15:206259-210718(+) / protein_length=206 / sequence_SO=supercontig / SO=protein_coding / is_pseudo=false